MLLITGNKASDNPHTQATREVLHNYVLVLANTGMRHGTEALNLQWKNLLWLKEEDQTYLDGKPNLAALDYASSALRHLEHLSMDVERERHLCRRYLGEARSRRRRALRACCAFNSGENQNSRNELKSWE